MNKLYEFFSGIVIGAGVVMPGVSGSVLAIMLGIYNKVIFLLNDSKKRFLTKIKNIFPIFIGLLIGIILFGNILQYFYKIYKIQMCYMFIGLILGGLPILNGEITSKNKKINKKYLFITFIISALLFILPNFFMNINFSKNNTSFFILLIGGFLYISGKIIPGISSSFFLIILGLYDYILQIMANPFSLNIYDYIKIIPFFIGVILGFIILIKFINYLLNYHFANTYSCIIGFVLGSILAIFPGFKLKFIYYISVLISIISFYFTYKMTKKYKK